MNAPDYAEAFEELARERKAHGPDVAESLGVADVEELRKWATEDALESMVVIGQSVAKGIPSATCVEAMLASHTELGVALGLWLVKTGRVAP